ncbi:MAG: kynureninase [Pseudohongiellaceae bacterium]
MTEDDIIKFDTADPLAAHRRHFELPTDTIYLNGNSLGPLSTASKHRVREVVESQWGNDLISSWNKHQWIDLPLSVGEKIAPLIGAAPGQVLCCDSVSVNLFKLLAAALTNRAGKRTVILSQQDNFPSDLYIAEGLINLLQEHGISAELRLVAAENLEEGIAQSPDVLLLTHVNFRTGAVHDMQRLTARAHDHDVPVIWDLSHSAGAMELALDDCQVDFAVGCGYKFLNGGPGAPAFLYVASRLQAELQQPLQGWMGHKQPFAFEPKYVPDAGINQLQTGTPSILSMSALDAALSCFEGLTTTQLREKSLALSTMFLSLLEEDLTCESLTLVSPREPEQRGAQLSFSHDDAFPISQALIEAGVIVDFRAPDLIRLGFSPLFLSFNEVAKSAAILRQILTEGQFRQERFSVRAKVT